MLLDTPIFKQVISISVINPITTKSTKIKITVEEVLFKWRHHRISLTDLKVRTTLHVFITDWDHINQKSIFALNFFVHLIE